MNIGLEITKNSQKYSKLLGRLQQNLDEPEKFNFIHLKTRSDTMEKINSLNVLVSYGIDEKTFNLRSESLRWIHFGTAGIDHCLSKSVLGSKVIISNSIGIHAQPIAEFVIGMILYFFKQFPGAIKFMNSSEWSQWDLAKKIIHCHTQTVGIIGYGNIGKAIAKQAKALGMKVIATRRLQKKIETKKIVDELRPMSDLKFLLSNSDVVVISCPLTPLTRGMISKKEISMMKKTSYLINISRGEILDEEDLIEALKNKKIAGAGLDVFAKEPLSSESELFKLDNVFLTPHISGNFPGYQERVIDVFADNLNRFSKNKSIKNRVCKKRQY
tara:strand:- start:690 stop:1673 length:984 start_codon:yes stop_codon:yes gene_type:complete